MERRWLVDIRGDRTQKEIAELAGISRCYYSQIERGTRRPGIEVAKKIATVMGIEWPLFFDNKMCEKHQKRRVKKFVANVHGQNGA